MDTRSENAIFYTLHRIRKDLEEIKSSQLAGAKSFDLQETILNATYVNNNYAPFRVILTFISARQDYPLTELGYEVLNGYDDFIEIQKIQDNSSPRITKFEAYFGYTDVGTPMVIRWHLLSTDRGALS